MKNTTIAIISVILIIVLGLGLYLFYNNTVANKAKENLNVSEDNKSQQNIINEIENIQIPNNTVAISKAKVETELFSFSTNLKGDSARLNNINITCNTINGTTIKNGETFSFNSIVGQPTAEKGYQEADVFIDQKTEKGYGGGNCQVSTTIYNTALNIDGLEIIERHPHKKKVSYIEEGKDAAVSYSGGLDLKFKNNTGYDIKIYVSSDDDSVDAKIVELQ